MIMPKLMTFSCSLVLLPSTSTSGPCPQREALTSQLAAQVRRLLQPRRVVQVGGPATAGGRRGRLRQRQRAAAAGRGRTLLQMQQHLPLARCICHCSAAAFPAGTSWRHAQHLDSLLLVRCGACRICRWYMLKVQRAFLRVSVRRPAKCAPSGPPAATFWYCCCECSPASSWLL